MKKLAIPKDDIKFALLLFIIFIVYETVFLISGNYTWVELFFGTQFIVDMFLVKSLSSNKQN